MFDITPKLVLYGTLLAVCSIVGCSSKTSEVAEDSSNESSTASVLDVPPVDASDLLETTLVEAKRQNKNVIVVFDGPSCGWCMVLKKFLAKQAKLFDQDYIVLQIDQVRMKNGEVVKAKFTADKSIPWTAIVDPDGEVLCTSVGDKGNIGCPIANDERKHFISMIEQSAIRLAPSDFEKIAQELDNFAEPIRQMVEKGERDSLADLMLAPD